MSERGAASMEPVRIGVVGCGVIGRVHLANAAGCDEMAVVAVADVREEAAREAAEAFGVGTVYKSAEALIADDRIEGVILALPTGVRFGPAREALAAGKHVLLEKPPAMNAGELEALLAMREGRVVACCSSRYRFLGSAEAATAFLTRGGLGALRVVHIRATRAVGPLPEAPPPAWRVSRKLNGGGILVNWGVYDLDFCLGIAGWSLRPRAILARTWPAGADFSAYLAPGSDAETHVVATILCDNGVAIQFERGEFVPAQGTGAWQFTGETGALRLQMSAEGRHQVFHDHVVAGEGVQTEVLYEGEAEAETMHRGVLRDFARAIRTGGAPKTSLENALELQRVCDGIYRSAERGELVLLA